MPLDPLHTLEAYSLHGFTSAGAADEMVLDYTAFFNEIECTDPHLLQYKINDDVVAITEQHVDEGCFSFRFVAGNPQDLPLIYDIGAASTTEINPGDNRVVVRGAWVIVVPNSRIVIVEKRRPGITIFQIEKFLTRFGREQLGLVGLSIAINPIPSSNFTKEVKQLTRIREATVVMRRPNYSWGDMAKELIGAPAAESNAAEIRIQINADRNQSLANDRGMIHDLLKLVQSPITGLKNAIVRGQSPTQAGEYTVSLEKTKLRETIRIPKSATEKEVREGLGQLANNLIDSIHKMSKSAGGDGSAKD